MRYLLDTNILIFVLMGDKDNISADVQQIIDDFSNTLYVSSLSIVEVVYLFENEKIKTKHRSAEALCKAIEEDLYIQILHTKDEHLKTYSRLKLAENHKDQIDHFIISQAVCEKIPLVSSDRKFYSYIPQNLDFVYNKR
ncbi:MAG: type II toxin-antitoxin system VapC family toxin [Bergeyella sp.]